MPGLIPNSDLTVALALDRVDGPAQFCWIALAQRFLALCPDDTRLVVDPDGLDDWLFAWLRDPNGSEWRGISLESVAISPEQSFAVTGSAGGMLRGVVCHVGRLMIRPLGPPRVVDEELFWSACVSGGCSGVVRDMTRRTGHEFQASAQSFLASVVPAAYRASLITSVFDADRFLVQFLDNMALLRNYDDCQHLLIRPGSPGSEHEALLEHALAHPGVIYINLPVDPGLYETWNLAAVLSTGRYLSNANVDDRRHPAHVRVLSELLDERAGSDVASGALRVTETVNQEWSDAENCPVWFGDQDELDYQGARLIDRHRGGRLVAKNRPHCMPLWRRSLHLLHGFFNEQQYGPSADWEMWLRCGEGGSRFSRLARPLGLYLKHPESYWRRDNDARWFDERIKARYTNVLESRAESPPMRSLPWRDLERFRRAGQWLGVFVCLQRVHDLSLQVSGDAERRRELVQEMGARWFGPGDWINRALGRKQRTATEALGAVEAAALSRVLSFGESGAVNQLRQWHHWQALLIDLHRLTGSVAPIIALAWLERMRHGGQASEAEYGILQAAWGMDARGFWRALQRVYRFAVPLRDLVRRFGEMCVVADHDSLADKRKVRLFHFPSYSNKYQELLYWPLKRAGAEVRGVQTAEDLARLQPDQDRFDVVHLHWLNAVFDQSEGEFGQRAQWFLDQLRDLQQRGFQVFWTVHNRLDHDSRQPEEEREFRARLARLVDRVYLHHPILRHELDWLPPEVEPWLCEHGPYVEPVRGGIDKSVARRRLQIDPDARVCLWFGQMRPYKALDVYLPTILRALRRHPDALVIVAGKVRAPDVREMLADAGEQAIFINRHVPNIELQHLANAADFGLLTYRDILTSGAMFHLYCTGLPVIAPDLGAMAGYVLPEWNGYLYEDADELESSMERACTATDAAIVRLAGNARATSSTFRWGRIL